jgi:putative transposase
MARLPRLTVAGYPHHVIQRGNNRQAIFVRTSDYDYFRALLTENAQKFNVAVHAYVLMTNHVHLLATPADVHGLPLLMQAVGRRYVRYFNDVEGRSGTLWEGRYRSTLIDTDRYLLACMAYIDLNPVRAGLVVRPVDYFWSSHRHYIGQFEDRLVTPHALFWTLGNTPFSREAAYAELVQNGVVHSQQDELTRSVMSGWPLGDTQFADQLQKYTERRVQKVRAGRPLAKPKIVSGR